MTSTSEPTVTFVRRLLSPPVAAPEPSRRKLTPSLGDLLHVLESSGLTGRGGAGFPTPFKVRAVARDHRRPVVVGNAMEGEPLSQKDAVLLNHNPLLVLEGLEVMGRALGAKRVVLAVHEDADTQALERHARAHRVSVVPLAGGFVAGQESALVNQLNGQPGLPSDPFRRVWESGVDGRPTLVLNAETLAQVALVVRHGPEWFRGVGTPDDPGSSLFTISGAVERPGVVEAARGSRLVDVLTAARPVDPAAILVGGYHGSWVPAGSSTIRLTNADLSAYGATVGAGVLHVLGGDTCPLALASRVVDYLATESARQCGPCVNGLPRLATDMRRLASRDRDVRLPDEISEMARIVTGRGACAHPDGSARFVRSTLAVFRGHVRDHLDGRCHVGGATPS